MKKEKAQPKSGKKHARSTPLDSENWVSESGMQSHNEPGDSSGSPPANDLEVKLEVITGNPFSPGSIAAGSGRWGQPALSATGTKKTQSKQALSSVTVTSRNEPGGACNTVDQPEPSGTIKLFVRSKQTGDYKITIFGEVKISGVGPKAAAFGKLETGGNIVINGFGTTAIPFSQSGNYDCNVHVTNNWTLVAQFTPTIGLQQDFGVQSAAWVVGLIQFLMGTRQ